MIHSEETQLAFLELANKQLERELFTIKAQLAVAVEALNEAWKQVEIMSPVEATIEKALAEIKALGGGG